MAEVNLESVVKRFGDVEVVRGIDLKIANEEFVALVGPSGCGKSTTLRMIAGLEEVTDGVISIGGRDVTDVAPKDRDIAMVFQSYALYPHMTVKENMSFGLRQQRTPRDVIEQRVERGGAHPQHRGIAVAQAEAALRRPAPARRHGPRHRAPAQGVPVRRAAVEPRCAARVQMRTEIKRLRQKVRTTTVYVTHDQVEALTLADRIVVMNKGRIEQIGTPHDLYHAPATQFVAGFIGSPSMNFLPFEMKAAGDGLVMQLGRGWSLPVPAERRARYAGLAGRSDLLLGLRPEHFSAAREPLPAGEAAFDTVISIVEPVGLESFVYFRMAEIEICARLPPDSGAQEGRPMRLAVRFEPDACHRYPDRAWS